jgi:hypothetical protein
MVGTLRTIDFLTSSEYFEITEDPNEGFMSKTYRPRYFAESLGEYILPCIQGVSDRMHHSRLGEPDYNEIRRRLSTVYRHSSTSKSLNFYHVCMSGTFIL